MKTEVSQQVQRETVREWLGTGSVNVFGIQFSGKDTQCNRLAAWLNGVVLGGGDVLRNAKNVPDRVKEIIDRGDLAPIEDYLAIMTPYFGQRMFDGRPLLLSSVGRYHGEEAGVLQASEAAGHPTRAVVLLELSEDAVWQRWKLMHEVKDREARTDDSTAGLERRLKRFAANTKPVLDFYRKQGLLFAVDGSKSPDEVEAEILRALYDRAVASR